MKRSISLKESSEKESKKLKRDYSIYDAVPAVLEVKADALDLAKLKDRMPVEAARLVDHILEQITIAVRAVGSGDIGDLLADKQPPEIVSAVTE